MTRRAEGVDETRQRIVEAALHLHTTIGPARTTISAIAEEAGVTRLTVYRHFPTADELYAACTTHWMSQHPRPDPSTWMKIKSSEQRARKALTELYDWYRENADDQFAVRRDVHAMPVWVGAAMRNMDAQGADAIVAGSTLRGAARRRLRAAAGHAVSYDTWRSLAIDQGLEDDEAAQLMTKLLFP
jgi:AcrR family transcriptional regulator